MTKNQSWRLFIAVGAIALIPSVSFGFPPAPDHVVFGMIRDSLGAPVQSTTAVVSLETTSGVVLKASIVPGLRPGANYKISIPMDSRITDDPYHPTALLPALPFKIKVKIGPTTYLPIEMAGNYALLGQPGAETRIDLTLGEDADGDGLPDAWELALAAKLGGNQRLIDIHPEDDPDHDGLSNLNEYLAGTYSYDPKDGFLLSIVRISGTNLVLSFTAIKRRTYSLYQSSDLKNWKPVSFRLVDDTVLRSSYPVTDTRLLQVEVPAPVPAGPGGPGFFKLMVF